MKDVVIVSALRTPIGAFGGAFKDLLPTDLTMPVLNEVMRQSGVPKHQVDEVILGHCIQRTNEPNTARTAALMAGFPDEVTGYTVQRQCASGMQAIISAAMQIQTGLSDVVIAGGVEAMSSSPYLVKQQRWGSRLGHSELTDSVSEILEDPIHHIKMGETAERLADKYEISREEQDELALLSHQRANKAMELGLFETQIVPVTVQTKRSEIVITEDEGPRDDITADKLVSLKPVFRSNGTVTAGNASSLNDGAAALLLMSADKAAKLGVNPIAIVRAFTVSGVDPLLMGRGPVPSIEKGLKQLGWQLNDVDLWEINEAFAAQYITVERELGLDRNKVNVNGSGISLGHPIGCSGARIIVTLVHELKRRKVKKGVGSLCVGGGMGTTVFIEML